jgi:hypothetical protein
MEDILDDSPRLIEERALCDETADDALYWCDFGVLKPLKPPTVKLET